MIGSSHCLFLFWLVGVIALVLVFRQSFENRSNIDKDTKCFLTQPSPIVILSKIHKQGNLGTQSVLSSHGNPTERVLQFFNCHIQPPVKTTNSFIKSTIHFLTKLEQLEHLPDNAFLVTIDVSSLYINIPHNEDIDACWHFLSTRPRNAWFSRWTTSPSTTKTSYKYMERQLEMNGPLHTQTSSW